MQLQQRYDTKMHTDDYTKSGSRVLISNRVMMIKSNHIHSARVAS